MTLPIYSTAWAKVKRQLNADRQDLTEELIAERDHDKSMLIRGKIQMIDEILSRYPLMLQTANDED